MVRKISHKIKNRKEVLAIKKAPKKTYWKNINDSQQARADNWKSFQNRDQKEIIRYCCGKPNHVSKQFKFKDYSCNACGRRGHLKQVCSNLKRGSREQRRVQLMQLDDDGAAAERMTMQKRKKVKLLNGPATVNFYI